MTARDTTHPLPDGLSQQQIDSEMAGIQAAAPAGAHHPPRDYPRTAAATTAIRTARRSPSATPRRSSCPDPPSASPT